VTEKASDAVYHVFYELLHPGAIGMEWDKFIRAASPQQAGIKLAEKLDGEEHTITHMWLRVEDNAWK
jgi:hypothetical protein